MPVPRIAGPWRSSRWSWGCAWWSSAIAAGAGGSTETGRRSAGRSRSACTSAHAPTFRSQTTLLKKIFGPKLQNWWYTNCIHFWWFDSPVKSGGYKLQHATTTGLANLHSGVLNPCPSQTTKFGCSSCTTNFGVGVPPLTEFQETIFGWTKILTAKFTHNNVKIEYALKITQLLVCNESKLLNNT